MYTQPGLDVLKIGVLTGHQILCMKTESERKGNLFDGKYRGLSEPYAMTLQLTYHSYEMIHTIDVLEVSQIQRLFLTLKT